MNEMIKMYYRNKRVGLIVEKDANIVEFMESAEIIKFNDYPDGYYVTIKSPEGQWQVTWEMGYDDEKFVEIYGDTYVKKVFSFAELVLDQALPLSKVEWQKELDDAFLQDRADHMANHVIGLTVTAVEVEQGRLYWCMSNGTKQRIS
jgi:hypothetical protein